MPTPLRAGLVALVLASPAALAQTLTLSFSGSGSAITGRAFSQSDCNNNAGIVVTWAVSALGQVCNNLQVFVTNGGSCPTTPSTGSDGGTADVIIGTFSATDLAAGTGNTSNFAIRNMPGLGGACPDGVDLTNAVCGSVQYRPSGATDCTTLNSSSDLTVRFDSKPPPPPIISSLLPQDSKIIVQLDPNGETDTAFYRVQYAAQLGTSDAGLNFITIPDFSAQKNSVTIDSLTNNQLYVVQAFQLDEVNNLSPASAQASGTPLASNGFWAEYKAANGHEQGGCNVADATFPSVLGALGVLFSLWRRKRR
jgi:hypothetical protein